MEFLLHGCHNEHELTLCHMNMLHSGYCLCLQSIEWGRGGKVVSKYQYAGSKEPLLAHTYCLNGEGLNSLNLFYFGSDLAEFCADIAVTWKFVGSMKILISMKQLYGLCITISIMGIYLLNGIPAMIRLALLKISGSVMFKISMQDKKVKFLPVIFLRNVTVIRCRSRCWVILSRELPR